MAKQGARAIARHNVIQLVTGLQALHLFKKAEILLETMNKELDKNRVMANRTPRSTFIQRTFSTTMSAGPPTPGAALQPVSRVRHARWNRQMASMWMTAGNVDTGRFHSLRALHILGAPLPVAEEVNHRSACLCCPCGSALLLIGRQGRAGPLPASPTHGSVSDLAATTAWTDKPSRASQSDIGSLPSVSSDLRNEFKDHTNEERQEAAAVLMLLVTAELQIEPPDPEAFRYILQTCCYFEVRARLAHCPWGGHKQATCGGCMYKALRGLSMPDVVAEPTWYVTPCLVICVNLKPLHLVISCEIVARIVKQISQIEFGLQDLDYGSRIGSSSPMYGVSQKCRAALKTLRHRNRQRFFSLSGHFDSRGQALKVPSVSVKHGSDNRVHPVDV